SPKESLMTSLMSPSLGRRCLLIVGAEAGTRTPTPLRALDPETGAGEEPALRLFCVVLHNSAALLGFSLLALRTEPDSRRTRGLKSSSLTGAFSANQRKPLQTSTNFSPMMILGDIQGHDGLANRAQ